MLFVFGFIVAATLGCSAGSTDLTDGMFRHLVITGRSRLALYFARIPAGLAIVIPMVAAGFTIVCAVCVFAAPTKLSYNGVTVPANLSAPAFQTWAADHPREVVCGFSYNGPGIGIPCFINNKGHVVIVTRGPGNAPVAPTHVSAATWRADAVRVARQDYVPYSHRFLYPSNALMIESGLWVELEAIVGFIVGLGLASLMGQRTVPVVLMIVLEVILTPLFSRTAITHLINVQRGLVGLAMAHIEPGALPQVFGGGGNGGPSAASLVPETTTVAVIVIVAWLVGWTALGAWRMARRDA